MKRLALVLPVLVVASAVFAGGLQKEQVAAGAKWVVHLDIEALVASQVGQFLRKQLEKEGLEEHIQQFVKAFGFDPLKDLKGLTAYGLEHGDENAIAVFQGNVDKQKILDLLEANEGHKESKYGEATVHQWTEKGKAGGDVTKYGCFYGDDLTVITASLDLLKTAVDVLDKKKDSLAKSDSLPILNPSAGSFALLAAEDFAVAEKAKPDVLLKKLQSVSLEMGEANKSVFIKGTAVAKTAKDAEEIRRIVDGLLALVSFAGQQGEDQADPVKAQALAMLKQVQVSAKEQAVSIEASWDVEQVTSLLEKVAAAKKQAPKTEK